MTEISRTPPPEVEKLVLGGEIAKLREFFAGEGDEIAYRDALELRRKVEPLEGWIATKELARKEMESLPPDTFERLSKRLEPYVAVLPAGHSRGHILRDAINAVLIANDPEIAKADPVEVFVGMVGGTFHDIGNAVVNRYDERIRLAGHAEVFAYLMEIVGRDIIPPHLRLLTRYVGAAHTHYLEDLKISQNGKVFVRKPYQDEVVDGNRLSVWTTQWADRLDTNGPTFAVRHIMTKVEPRNDFTGGKFDAIWPTPEEDFKHQFTPVFRTEKAREQMPKPINSARVLEHLESFADSNYDINLPYAKYDTAYYRWGLITPLVAWQRAFVLSVVADPPEFSEAEVAQDFENLFRLCRKLEPCLEIDPAIGVLREKFALLSDEERRHWANGFRALDDQYKSWYSRVGGLLDQKIETENPKLQELVANLRKIGRNSLFGFMP